MKQPKEKAPGRPPADARLLSHLTVDDLLVLKAHYERRAARAGAAASYAEAQIARLLGEGRDG